MSNSVIASVPKHTVLKRLLSNTYLGRIDLAEPANLSTGPYYLRSGIKPKSLKREGVVILPTDTIYPVHGDLEQPDKCVSYSPRKGFKKYVMGANTSYINYPCKAYPKSYIIKHFDIGGTWIRLK
jgi:hypothetical protein